ncbi:MAG: hypothetical protein R3F02_19580 [Thiolinea sp.]
MLRSAGFAHCDVFASRRCFVIVVTGLIGGEGTGTCCQQGNGVAGNGTHIGRTAAQYHIIAGVPAGNGHAERRIAQCFAGWGSCVSMAWLALLTVMFSVTSDAVCNRRYWPDWRSGYRHRCQQGNGVARNGTSVVLPPRTTSLPESPPVTVITLNGASPSVLLAGVAASKASIHWLCSR